MRQQVGGDNGVIYISGAGGLMILYCIIIYAIVWLYNLGRIIEKKDTISWKNGIEHTGLIITSFIVGILVPVIIGVVIYVLDKRKT